MTAIDETETTVVYDHRDKVYRVWANYQPHIRKFDKDCRASRTGGDDTQATFVVSAEDFNITGGFRRRVSMTEEQRKKAAERLRAVRENQR